MQIDQPIGSFCSDTEWMLNKPWRVRTRLGTLLILPGFKSDGASIPKFLWSLVGPRFAPTTFAAALAHDALYAAIQCSRREADGVFLDILIELNETSQIQNLKSTLYSLISIAVALDILITNYIPWPNPIFTKASCALLSIINLYYYRWMKPFIYWAFVRIFGWMFYDRNRVHDWDRIRAAIQKVILYSLPKSHPIGDARNE